MFKKFFIKHPIVIDWMKEAMFLLNILMKPIPFFLIIIVIAIFIGEYDFAKEQVWPWAVLKYSWIPFIVLVPYSLLTKKYKQIDEFKNVIDNRHAKDQLANDLKEIRKKNPYEMIDPSSPYYTEILTLLRNSAAISPAYIYFFEEGRFPPRWEPGTIPLHPNQVRGIILQQLIDNIMLHTFY